LPHFTIEYSANLESLVNISDLCLEVRRAALETGIFPEGGIRVRAVKFDHYAIADLHPDNGFINILIRIGMGRELAAKRTAGAAIFEAAIVFLAEELAKSHFALSMDIQEINAELSWKKNTMHSRLNQS